MEMNLQNDFCHFVESSFAAWVERSEPYGCCSLWMVLMECNEDMHGRSSYECDKWKQTWLRKEDSVDGNAKIIVDEEGSSEEHV